MGQGREIASADHRPDNRGDKRLRRRDATAPAGISPAPEGRCRRPRLQDDGRARADPRPDRPGPRAARHPVRRQHQGARFQHVRARSAGLGQEHGGQGLPRPQGPAGALRFRLGLRLQLRQPQPAACARAAVVAAREELAQGMVAAIDELRSDAAGHVRGRGLPGPPARHRRAVPLRPGGGARGA